MDSGCWAAAPDGTDTESGDGGEDVDKAAVELKSRRTELDTAVVTAAAAGRRAGTEARCSRGGPSEAEGAKRLGDAEHYGARALRAGRWIGPSASGRRSGRQAPSMGGGREKRARGEKPRGEGNSAGPFVLLTCRGTNRLGGRDTLAQDRARKAHLPTRRTSVERRGRRTDGTPRRLEAAAAATKKVVGLLLRGRDNYLV
jgi:hypothetical protein